MAETTSTPRRRPGRPSKGERFKVTGLLPTEHTKVYEEERVQLGLEWTDFIAFKMAVSSGLEVPDYISNVIALHSRREHPGEGAVAV